ncbi:TetR/AcrR family transcriptional regulator [Nocardia uniformis]|uniref:TetR/AcrR family transcriptional regulator n=1 Tax=Nocardia uniformis TaxID=53432 RepID=A0A849CFI0_9NOCA|nr:TetR/AcrR family transcriptional regulator [Nocardia uniformis]NNH75287.1 TetR/AcrR family transcriptional regulator [Nocardia uniformis]
MTRARMKASERMEEVLTAAVSAFAESGYAATKTDEIARRAGVSQPYVIRLFQSKQQLFLATLHRVCDRIEEVFRTAAAEAATTDPDEILPAMGHAYKIFLADRDLLLVLLHGFSAASDPAIGPDVRDRYGHMYNMIRETTGAPVSEVRRFMATGMLMTVMAAMQVVGPDAIETTWATEMLDDLEAHGD